MVGVVAGLLALSLSGGVSEGWDWLGAPFDLRLGLALDRNSAFTDVVGLSASAAYPYGSSVNLANSDFLRAPPNEFKIAVTGTGIYVPFETSTYTTAGAGSVSFRFDDAGTAMGIYSNSGSHDAHSTQGDNYRLNSQDFTIRYGQLAMPRLALGGEFKVTESSLTFEPGGFQEFPVHTKTNATGYDSRVGALVAHGRSGMVLCGHGRTRGRSHRSRRPGEDQLQYLHPVDQLADGRGLASLGEVQRVSRLGVLPAMERRGFRLRGARVRGRRVHALARARLARRRIRRQVGKTTASAGIGFYGVKHLLFELAYVYNAFSEIRQEFGVAHLVSSSIVIFY